MWCPANISSLKGHEEKVNIVSLKGREEQVISRVMICGEGIFLLFFVW